MSNVNVSNIKGWTRVGVVSFIIMNMSNDIFQSIGEEEIYFDSTMANVKLAMALVSVFFTLLLAKAVVRVICNFAELLAEKNENEAQKKEEESN